MQAVVALSLRLLPKHATAPAMKNPTTLITGAGVRIGAEIARHLAARGHNLVLHYHHSKEAAEQLARQLQEVHGTQVTLVRADLEAFADGAAFNALPPVTHIIHNAARFLRDELSNFSAQGLRTHLATNLEAPLLLSQWFMAQLPQDVEGTILVLGDGSKRWSVSPQFFTYGVSKLAWESVIDLLAASVAPRARANVIALAPTLPGEQDSEEVYQRLAHHAPLARNSSFKEICTTVDFLLASPGITGQTISLAGGFGLTTHRSTPY